MRRFFLVLALAACSRAPDPAPGTAVYEPVDRGFSCRIPAEWRVQEADGGAHRASFFGPPDGPAPFPEAISVFRYGPKSVPPTMEAFVAAKSLEGTPAAPAKTTVGGREALDFLYASTLTGPHLPGGRVTMSHRAVLVADGDGYWALVHSWPEKSPSRGDAFKALVETFRPVAGR